MDAKMFWIFIKDMKKPEERLLVHMEKSLSLYENLNEKRGLKPSGKIGSFMEVPFWAFEFVRAGFNKKRIYLWLNNLERKGLIKRLPNIELKGNKLKKYNSLINPSKERIKELKKKYKDDKGMLEIISRAKHNRQNIKREIKKRVSKQPYKYAITKKGRSVAKVFISAFP